MSAHESQATPLPGDPGLPVAQRLAGKVAIVTGATGLVAGGTMAAAEPYETSLYTVPRTTRIEPRPFYGATVTIEAGVRVFRPLPPHDRVIIDPTASQSYQGTRGYRR